jgi:hypothetical protein
LARIDTRRVTLDAAHVHSAKLLYAILGVGAERVDTCLEEAFSGEKRYEGVVRAESRLLKGIELESEVRRVGALVSLPEPR